MLKKLIITAASLLSLSSCENSINPVEPVTQPDSVVIKFTNYSNVYVKYYSENNFLNCTPTKDTLFVKIPYNSKIGYLTNSNYCEIVGTKDTIIN